MNNLIFCHGSPGDAWVAKKEAAEAKLERQQSLEERNDLKLYLIHKEATVQDRAARGWRVALPCKRDKYNFSLIAFLRTTIGKDLTKVPMPVFFNEPLSFLQRLTEDVEYADVLNKAAACTCTVERLAYIAAFASSNFANVPGRFWKPFNPLLGETYEFHHDEHKYHVIAEQVCHHPPVSAMHIEGDGWVFWQEYRLDTRFRGMHIKICPTGIVHLRMKSDGTHYSWKKPSTSIHNIIFGTLWADHEGAQVITCHQTKEEAVVFFRPHKKVKDDYQKLTGHVTDKDGVVQYTLHGGWIEGLDAIPTKEGSKTQELKLWEASVKSEDAHHYFGLTQFALRLNEPDESIKCPSDSRLRPDQRLLENGQVDEAGKEKYRLEEKQRAARKKREHEKIEWEPRWFTPYLDPDTGTVSHVYKGGYWTATVAGNFSACPDIF